MTSVQESLVTELQELQTPEGFKKHTGPCSDYFQPESLLVQVAGFTNPTPPKLVITKLLGQFKHKSAVFYAALKALTGYLTHGCYNPQDFGKVWGPSLTT